MFYEALLEEVRLIMKYKYACKYDDDIMKQAIAYIFTGDNNSDVPDEL